MRKFKVKGRVKRNYTRKKTQNPPAFSKAIENSLLPILVLAVALTTTAVISLHLLIDSTPVPFSVSLPHFNFSGLLFFFKSEILSLGSTVTTFKVPQVSFTFALPHITFKPAPIHLYPFSAIPRTVGEVISSIFQAIVEIGLVLLTIFQVTIQIIARVFISLNPLPLIVSVLEFLTGLVQQGLNQGLSTVFTVVHLVTEVVSSLIAVVTIIAQGIFTALSVCITFIIHILVAVANMVIKTAESVVVFLFHSLVQIVAFIGTLFIALIKTIFSLIHFVFIGILSVINSIIDTLARLVLWIVHLLEMPFIIIANYFLLIWPYIQLTITRLNVTTTEISASFAQTFSLIGAAVKFSLFK